MVGHDALDLHALLLEPADGTLPKTTGIDRLETGKHFDLGHSARIIHAHVDVLPARTVYRHATTAVDPMPDALYPPQVIVSTYKGRPHACARSASPALAASPARAAPAPGAAGQPPPSTAPSSSCERSRWPIEA